MTQERYRELERFITAAFPDDPDAEYVRIEAIGAQSLKMRLLFHERFLRPGQSISGPTLMKLVDMATYMVLIAHDERAKASVTSSLSIHFLRRPAPGDLVAVSRILKSGRTLAVVQVDVFDADEAQVVATASVSYAVVSPRESV